MQQSKPILVKYFIKISYLGTNYHGWQKQSNVKNTIQEILEEKFKQITRYNTNIFGSSRTDAEVHASNQVAHINLPATLNPKEIIYRVNSILPRDISVDNIRSVKENAHARFDAISRTYNYLITTKKNPFLINQALVIHNNLDIELLNKSANILKKHTNFKCFCKQSSKLINEYKSIKESINNLFRCHIMDAHWARTDSKIIFHIEANRFLRGMVRAIVGTSLKVALKEITLEKFENIIKSKDRSQAHANISSKGLYLVGIRYQ